MAARRAVSDDIENRRFAFGEAVRYLIRTAAKSGTVAEEMAWIEEQRPGIFDIDAAQVPAKLRATQNVAMDGWIETLPRDEMLRRLDVLLAYADSVGVDPTSNPNSHISILVFRGQIDDAIDLALAEVFSDTVAVHLNWRDTLMQPHYAEVVADPRVRDALKRWEEESAALRGSVLSFFNDLQTSS